MSLKEHYNKKIGRISNEFAIIINKLDDADISRYILNEYFSKLEAIDASLDTLFIEIQDLSFTISNFIDEKTHLTDEDLENIQDEKDRKKVIKDCFPLMLSYYMMLQQMKEREQNNELENEDNNELENEDNKDIKNKSIGTKTIPIYEAIKLENDRSDKSRSNIYDLD